MTSSKRLQIGSELDAYRLESLLGAGGMGEVYRAKDLRLGRWVPIKVLLPQISADVDARRRFEREARAIANLNHPNICRLHDIGSEEGVDYIVMEYLGGDTLAGILATRRERAGDRGPMTKNKVHWQASAPLPSSLPSASLAASVPLSGSRPVSWGAGGVPSKALTFASESSGNFSKSRFHRSASRDNLVRRRRTRG